MNIVITCDQLDCTFNVGAHVHHDHSTDICIHPHPNIQKWGTYPNWSKCTCNSKSTKWHDTWLSTHYLNNDIKDDCIKKSPSCDVCESTNSDDCINCCHNKYKSK